MRRAIVVFALTTLVAAQQTPTDSASEQKPVRRETVVVTGTFEPAPLEESNRTVDIVDVGQLQTLFRNWADALRRDATVDIRQRAPGTQADLSIRGSSFGQTLVLVDGIRVNDVQSAHHNLDLPIPLESIERIEVLHGSGSTLYGSDAVGGAVNFITAPPAATELRLRAGAGNFGTNTQGGLASLLAKRWSERLSFTRDFSSGFMPDRDYRNFAAASETRFQSSLGLSTVLLGLSDRPFGANRFYGNFNSWERTKGWFVAASQSLGGHTQLALGYRRHTDEFILLRDRPEVYENNHLTESWQALARRQARLTKNTALYYGAEVDRDSITSNNLGRHARDRGAAYLDFNARALGKFSLSLGARAEGFSQGTADFSPTASGGYWISSHFRLRASVAHAFRLPSYTDLYYSDPANRGNPNLAAEKSWDFEGGIEWNRGEHLVGSVTLFHRRDHEAIDYVRPNPVSLWRAANIGNVQFTGIEIRNRLKVGAQQLDLAYTGLYGAQQALAGLLSKYIFNYPIHQASAGWLGRIPGGVLLGARAGITERYPADAYPLAEVSVTRRFGSVEPYFQLTNLTNTGYEEVQGVRMPPRAYIIGMELTLHQRPRPAK